MSSISTSKDPKLQNGQCSLHLQGGHCSRKTTPSETVVDLLHGKQECVKLIKELVRETSHYSLLVIALGSCSDSEVLRDELMRTRYKAYELAHQNKAKLLPHLRDTRRMLPSQDVSEFERLWSICIYCIETLEHQVQQTFYLQTSFPLQKENVCLVNTGLSDTVLRRKCGSNLSLEHLDRTSMDKQDQGRDDLRALKKDINELRDLLTEMYQSVDLKTWTIEADFSTFNINYGDHSGDSSDTSSAVDVISDTDFGYPSWRKCVCLISVILGCIVVFATILGVCVALVGDEKH